MLESRFYSYGLNVKDAAKAFGEMLSYRQSTLIDEAREAMYAAKSSDDAELAWPATLPKFEPLVKVTVVRGQGR